MSANTVYKKCSGVILNECMKSKGAFMKIYYSAVYEWVTQGVSTHFARSQFVNFQIKMSEFIYPGCTCVWACFSLCLLLNVCVSGCKNVSF